MTPLLAELMGDTVASAQGIRVSGHAPVLKLCRALIEAGVDPGTPLHAYRGPTLCLKVRSIGEGAELRVDESGVRFAPYEAFDPALRQSISKGPQAKLPDSPMRLNGVEAV